MHQHSIPASDTTRLAHYLGEGRTEALRIKLERAAGTLHGRRLVNVTGDDQRKGGVYEIMRTTLPYLRGAGIDIVWLDLVTPPAARPALEFFHLLAHGNAPTSSDGDTMARLADFTHFSRSAATELGSLLRPSDVLLLHDTQTALTIRELAAWQDRLFWHAHIGTRDVNERVDSYWNAIGPSISKARARIFYCPEYAPPELRGDSIYATPGVDPAAPKNILMDRDVARTLLMDPPPDSPLHWVSSSGPQSDRGRIIAVQLSRWDALKDMPGAYRVFARAAEQNPLFTGIVVGPSAQSAAERRELQLCLDEQSRASPAARSSVHIGVIEECGTAGHDQAVRILQSAADVVLQKSIQEGFGLTVTEAMLRGKPVIASNVGGIPLQLRHNINGFLLQPNSDDEAWAAALTALAADAHLRNQVGTQARADAIDRHIVDRHLTAAIDGILNSLKQ